MPNLRGSVFLCTGRVNYDIQIIKREAVLQTIYLLNATILTSNEFSLRLIAQFSPIIIFESTLNKRNLFQ